MGSEMCIRDSFKGIYSSHNDHNYFEIAHSLQRQFAQGGIYKNICTYNFVDNHDVNRIGDNCRDRAHLKNIYTVLYTMPGVPSVYYGSEWGIHGTRTNQSDRELRPCLDLGSIPDADETLCAFLKTLGSARRSLPALQYGDFENTVIKNEQLVFMRRCEGQTVYVALNVANSEQWIGFHVDGSYQKLTDALTGDVFTVDNGWANIPVPQNGARVLVLHNGEFTRKLVQGGPVPQDCQREETPVPVTCGRYRHFKGNEYEVIGIAQHSETGEKLVVYKAMYGEQGLWVRPYDMFTEPVEQNGQLVARFTKLS